MNNELKVFESAEFGSVRVVEKDGEPWFVAKDVCDCLDIRTDTIRMILEEDEIDTTNPNTIGVAPGGRCPLIVSEPGLYSLILRSRKAKAKAFKRWVTHTILPTIRKHGVYAVESVLDDPDMLINALQALKAERAARLEAVRTKAEIGSRREATAMATASAAVRENQRLSDLLGMGQNYKSVKSLGWVRDYFKTNRGVYSAIGFFLKKLSAEMGLEVHRIDDTTYGTVNCYHVSVINVFQQRVESDASVMAKYRKPACARRS